LFENDENLNSIDYALKELDKGISDIFIYIDVKKFNKPVTVIQGLKDKDTIKTILRDLKKKLGTGGAYKNGIIILQGKHQEYVEKYLSSRNIIEK
jgi:translation initiation factor 1